MTLPAGTAASMALSNKSVRRARSSGTMVKITSAFETAAAGEGAMVPPNDSRRRTASRLRWTALVTAWPCLRRLAAMGKPILPRPKKAMFMIVSFLSYRDVLPWTTGDIENGRFGGPFVYMGHNDPRRMVSLYTRPSRRTSRKPVFRPPVLLMRCAVFLNLIEKAAEIPTHLWYSKTYAAQ